MGDPNAVTPTAPGTALRNDRRPAGSPFGESQFRPLRSPPPVEAWYNAFDNRDVVAL